MYALANEDNGDPMHNTANNPDACTYDCSFCGHVFPSDTLTRVVVPASNEEPEMLAQVCATCLDEARARGVLPAASELIDLGVLRGVFEGIALTVERTESDFRTPRPTIVVGSAPRTSWRRVSAAMHVLAALIESESPAREGWLPVLTDRGCVHLELSLGSEKESERGLALLRTIVARVRAGGR